MPFPRRLRGAVGRELAQTVRALVRWRRIHGSCFLQCFMPTATAALQSRANVAGEPSTLGRALSHGLNVKARPAGGHQLKGHPARSFSPSLSLSPPC